MVLVRDVFELFPGGRRARPVRRWITNRRPRDKVRRVKINATSPLPGHSPTREARSPLPPHRRRVRLAPGHRSRRLPAPPNARPAAPGPAQTGKKTACTPTSSPKPRRRFIPSCEPGHRVTPRARPPLARGCTSAWPRRRTSRTVCGGCPGEEGKDCTTFDPLAMATCVQGTCRYECPFGLELTASGCAVPRREGVQGHELGRNARRLREVRMFW